MRLFVALDLEESLRQRIALYLRAVESFAPEARWAKPESLHITLKFIGEQPPDRVSAIQTGLAAIHSRPISLALRGYGFFPTVPAARVFWLGIEAGEDLAKLAAEADTTLGTLGIPRDNHAFTPHLTLARVGSGAPRRQPGDQGSSRFRRLQQKLAAMPRPDFGTMTARDFFLYESNLWPGGARYTKRANFSLLG